MDGQDRSAAIQMALQYARHKKQTEARGLENARGPLGSGLIVLAALKQRTAASLG